MVTRMVTRKHIIKILSMLSQHQPLNPMGYNSICVSYFNNDIELVEHFVSLDEQYISKLQAMFNSHETRLHCENLHRIKYDKYNKEVLFIIGIKNWMSPHIVFMIHMDTCG